jgi:hypothetical protein
MWRWRVGTFHWYRPPGLAAEKVWDAMMAEWTTIADGRIWQKQNTKSLF